MKSVPPALAALINSGNFQFAHNYTITLFGSLGGQSVIRLTDADVDVQVGDANLLCLLHFDGTNGSTSFIDSIGRHTFSVQTGSPVLDTAAFEFGPSSFFTNGAAAQIVSDGGVASPDFQFNGAADFTVDFWVNMSNVGVQNNIFTLDAVGGGGGGQVIYYFNGGGFRWYDIGDKITGSTTVTANTWHHLALVRTSSVLTLYLDGVSQGTYNDGGKSYPGGIGPGGNFQFQGHIDEVRVRKGAAWTANFTPPTLPYSGGPLYSSKTVQVDQRANQRLAHWKRGLDVDTAVVVLAPRATDPTTGTSFPDKIGSVPFLEAARGGALDGADVQIDRVFFNNWPQPPTTPLNPAGSFTLFAGTPAEVDVNDTMVVLTVNDYRQLLQNKYPRVLYQLACTNTLFDAGCTLLPANFAVTGIVVAAGSTRQQIIATASVTAPTSPGSGTFTLGKITFTSGKNAGFSRTVRLWDGHTVFQLLTPFPFTVTAGDVFTAYAGCDKQQTTCTAFANLVNFGGEPFIPDATNAA